MEQRHLRLPENKVLDEEADGLLGAAQAAGVEATYEQEAVGGRQRRRCIGRLGAPALDGREVGLGQWRTVRDQCR